MIDPTNLWLTIHESIGHATELDRALGYEAAYAGTSLRHPRPARLAALRQRGHARHRRPDGAARPGDRRLRRRGRVAAQSWDLVRDGVLVGYQLDRRIAPRAGLDRSNGCAFADSPLHVPIQRMANVSLQPDPDGRLDPRS